MRIALFAATAALLALSACGGPETSQANNSQANIGNSASPPATAGDSAALPAQAPASKDEALKIMHERHETMEGLGKASKEIKRQLDATPTDISVIRRAATAYYDAAPKMASLFPPGTGPDVGKTGAKPEIWQNSADFEARIRDFQAATRAFADTAAHIDRDALRASFGDLQKTCKACHDKYRAKMEH
jgi:cytochrome c556